MARWNGEEHASSVLDAAASFQKSCLQQDGSLFGESGLWSASNIDRLKRAFVDNPQLDSASFIEKLERQLSEEPADLQKLAAEFLWVLLLFLHHSTYSVHRKIEHLTKIWGLSGEALDISHPLLEEDRMSGVGWPGTSYLVRLDREFEFLIRFMQAWKALSTEEQNSLLGAENPWQFCSWATAIPDGDRRGFRHLILYFLFPDSFERIGSKKGKREIVRTFSQRLQERISEIPIKPTPCDIDRALLEIRHALESDYGTPELDFYRPPLKPIWNSATPASQGNANAEALEGREPRYWIEKTIVRNRPDRLEGEHALGNALWSPQRSSNGADIYRLMRDVQPGDVVFHLTDNQAITAVSTVETVADDTFVGIDGTDWANQPAYRIELGEHEALSPSLGREDFLSKDPFSQRLLGLIEEADEKLFYNRELTLNQGAYLTEAPTSLIEILDDAYFEKCGKHLPMLFRQSATEKISESGDMTFDPKQIADDLFLDADEIDHILLSWRAKKNVILQGPPGVGKTFAAQRLAKLLMRTNSLDRLGFVQFHQSYSYEDFVCGFRPNVTGGFELRNGKFVDFCARALADEAHDYVFIIDEINRGNLSKILGELMMLIEPDKRSAEWALPLAYGDTTFFVPKNVYILGLMNTADRSLSVVDYALRRRFNFINLDSKIGSREFRDHLVSLSVSADMTEKIRDRIGSLNATIREDKLNLGSGFEIGHSYFCAPPYSDEAEEDWYKRIIATEIGPLLSEYWYDDPDKVSTLTRSLLGN